MQNYLESHVIHTTASDVSSTFFHIETSDTVPMSYHEGLLTGFRIAKILQDYFTILKKSKCLNAWQIRVLLRFDNIASDCIHDELP